MTHYFTQRYTCIVLFLICISFLLSTMLCIVLILELNRIHNTDVTNSLSSYYTYVYFHTLSEYACIFGSKK